MLRKGSKTTIPPRNNAGYWNEGHPRNEAVAALKSAHLADWKSTSGYHQRSLAETDMSRYKQGVSPNLILLKYNGQVGEILAGVKVMNQIIRIGMPVRQPVT